MVSMMSVAAWKLVILSAADPCPDRSLSRLVHCGIEIRVGTTTAGHRVCTGPTDEPDASRHANGINRIFAVEPVNKRRRGCADAEIARSGVKLDRLIAVASVLPDPDHNVERHCRINWGGRVYRKLDFR
jgi:hypothetical protein